MKIERQWAADPGGIPEGGFRLDMDRQVLSVEAAEAYFGLLSW
jgi:hypothetical protein